MQQHSTVTVQRLADGVALLCLNRPNIRNAVNLLMLEELVSALRSLDSDDAVRAIALCGQGKHFCAGLDFSTFKHISASLADESACPGKARTELFKTILSMQDACTAFEACSKPVVAAVHGACIGAAVDIITACDIRICAPNATFCVKEVDVAITADMGTLQRLPRIVGDGRARELALTARLLPATEALAYGLVTDIAHPSSGADAQAECADAPPEPLGAATPDAAAVRHRALRVAREIAAKPAGAVAGTKRVMLWGRGRPVEEGLRDVALLNSGALWSHDFRSALARGHKLPSKL